MPPQRALITRCRATAEAIGCPLIAESRVRVSWRGRYLSHGGTPQIAELALDAVADSTCWATGLDDEGGSVQDARTITSRADNAAVQRPLRDFARRRPKPDGLRGIRFRSMRVPRMSIPCPVLLRPGLPRDPIAPPEQKGRLSQSS